MMSKGSDKRILQRKFDVNELKYFATRLFEGETIQHATDYHSLMLNRLQLLEVSSF